MPSTQQQETQSKTPKKCGIIMPISACDGCTKEHWDEVRAIIGEAITPTGFVCELVSQGNFTNIIHQRIVENLYSNNMVVCDVSGRNPNVMFELGMRLAFDKPVILITDETTDIPFDVSPIEHLKYPRDLNYCKINEFKKTLSEKITHTHDAWMADPKRQSFLDRFKISSEVKLETVDITMSDKILNALTELRSDIRSPQRDFTARNVVFGSSINQRDHNACMRGADKPRLELKLKELCNLNDVASAELLSVGDHYHVVVKPKIGHQLNGVTINAILLS